jgi:hypothetical protein
VAVAGTARHPSAEHWTKPTDLKFQKFHKNPVKVPK